MAHINLLPWREAERQQKKKEFFTAIGVTVVIAGAIVGLVHMYVAGMIDYQVSRNDMLKQEIKIVEGKIKEIRDLERQKEQLIARMRVIEQLQSNRPEIVHLFDELAKLVPDGLHISKLDQKGKSITMNGMAQSNARVSAFMRRLEASAWFSDPKLSVISTKSQQGMTSREFTLQVTQVNGAKEGEE